MISIPLRQHNAGRRAPPDLLVIHWSAGPGEAEQVARYFARNPKRQASYHRAIGRDGGVVEMVPLADTAWHAGDGAAWDSRRVNDRSVGLCLCLRGYVTAEWAAAHPDRVLRAPHLKPNVRSILWERPTPAQVLALRAQIAEVATAQPSVRFVCGHDDLTRGKIDPGPVLDGVDLGLEALGLRRVRRRWDLPSAPWEGFETSAVPTPAPAPIARPRARKAPTPAAPPVREYDGPRAVPECNEAAASVDLPTICEASGV